MNPIFLVVAIINVLGLKASFWDFVGLNFLTYLWKKSLQLILRILIFAIKMRKIKISTSIWSAQHPNTGWNIQQQSHKESVNKQVRGSAKIWWVKKLKRLSKELLRFEIWLTSQRQR